MHKQTPSRNLQPPKRIVLVMSPASYRVGAFKNAADVTGIELIYAVDVPDSLLPQPGKDVAIDLSDTDLSVNRIVALAEAQGGVAAVIAIDDYGGVIAAMTSARLGLVHNRPDSALAARDKFLMRERLDNGGVPVPAYRRYLAGIDPVTIAEDVTYPCVVKPLTLSGSRGVIRANAPDEFAVAFERTRAILEASGCSADENHILVEDYVPGLEVALEGLLSNGVLKTLALFDKPDPLDGPFFEETIYVTPSRLEARIQLAIEERTAQAARAIGLHEGPIHAELRIDLTTENIWLIELAGRSIGGMCSSILEFGTGMSLEELILRHAANLPYDNVERSEGAAGAMMIPIPGGGMLRSVTGADRGRAVPGITGIEITAPMNQPVVPLPEGESYLGFIFARGAAPAEVEQALRDAHASLQFRIDPVIPIRPVPSGPGS